MIRLRGDKGKIKSKLEKNGSVQMSGLSDADRIKELELRMQQDREDFLEVSRTNQRLEGKVAYLEDQVEMYKQRMKELQDDMKVGSKAQLEKDAELNRLREKIKNQDALKVKNHKDIIDFITERKKLTDANSQLTAHIKELDTTLQELLERNQEITAALNEQVKRNKSLELDLENENRIRTRYEAELGKLRYAGAENNKNRAGIVEAASLAEVQKQLIYAKNTIKELELKNEKLRQYEEKAARLEISKEKKKKTIQRLEKLLDECRMELESYKSSAEEYGFQIEDLREKVRVTSEAANFRIQEMGEQIMLYENTISQLTERMTQMEQECEEEKRKCQEATEMFEDYQSKHYGIAEAVAQVRQLKTLVSVRDAYIADLIDESNKYQRVIGELENYLPADFDYDKFIKEIVEKIANEAQKNTYAKAVEILRSQIAKLKNAPIGDIKIVVGSNNGPQQVTVFNNLMAETESQEKAPKFLRDSITNQDSEYDSYYYYSDYDDEDESITNDQSSIKHRSSVGFPIHSSKLVKTLSLNDTGSIRRQAQEEKSRRSSKRRHHRTSTAKEQVPSTAPPQIIYQEAPKPKTTDTETNTEENDPFYTVSADILKDQDEWVRKLREAYARAKDEALRLKAELARLKQDNETLQSDNINLVNRADDLTRELNGLTGTYPAEPSVSNVTGPLKSQLTQTLVRLPNKLDRSAPHYLSKFEDVSSVLIVGGTILFPSVDFAPTYIAREQQQEERYEKVRSKNNALQNDVDKLRREVDTLQHKNEELSELLLQAKSLNGQLQNKLDEQRIAFKEKFVNLKNEADRYVETRVKDALELRAVQDTRAGAVDADPVEKLREYAMEMKRKNAKIAELSEAICERDETIRRLESQKEALRAQIKEESSSASSLSKSGLGLGTNAAEYNGELKTKLTHVQKKYNALLKEYNNLKRARAEQDSMLTTERSELSSNETLQRELTKLKGVKAKLVVIESRNEELELLLKKANNSVQQLNDLLQRKELKLGRAIEQSKSLKAQVQALKKELADIREGKVGDSPERLK